MNAICLPWPDKALNPNARVHYLMRHRAARKQRSHACYLGHGGKRLQKPFCTVLPIVATRRRRDLDNVLASLKSALDGLTDAGWWDDDHHIGGYHIAQQIHCPKLADNRVVIIACEQDELLDLSAMVDDFRIAAGTNCHSAASQILGVTL